ncbi:MAG: glycosyltransferase family 2 protein [Gammaproteobacteria bacterium]|nr:glycosyltransferase family 2 protein [Gammaproteobacteria bacterium]
MLSVALSTVDRADTLARTLQALCALQEPTGGWQLLVVDNGSVDHTSRVLADFVGRLPLQVHHCAERGKNRALNSIIPHFSGDLVVFTDDDVIPAADWLCQHRRLADKHPGAAVFGGPILPQWESPPPTWMTDAIPFDVCFGQTDSDWEEGVSPPRRIWGANMSVRATVFAEGYRFDPHRGPRSDSSRYLTGGETSFVKRLHEAGKTCWFSRGPVVRHLIREEQHSYEWVMQRGFRFGRLKGARHTDLSPRRGKALLHWLLLEARCALYSLRWASTSPEAWRARRDWDMNVLRGQWYQMSQSPAK